MEPEDLSVNFEQDQDLWKYGSKTCVMDRVEGSILQSTFA